MKNKMLWAVPLLILVLCLAGCTQKDAAQEASEPLLEFEARRSGADKPDLSAAGSIEVTVYSSLEVMPRQVLLDPGIISAAAKAIEKIEVTGGHDGTNYEDSGATVYSISFMESGGAEIAKFVFQNDEGMLLVTQEGRWPLKGTKELFSIEGMGLYAGVR